MINKLPGNLRVTYLDQKNPINNWKTWKHVSDCSKIELEQANLREILPNEIVLDLETLDTEIIEKDLKLDNLNYFKVHTGSRGIHYHLFFNELETYPIELRNKIREFYIKKFKCDIKKSNENTLISIPNKPHFKTLRLATVITQTDKLNHIEPFAIEYAKEQLKEESKYSELSKKVQMKDSDFNSYFEKDPFFMYLRDLKEPLMEGMSRNDTILKNLAIASAKSNKNVQEIQSIIEPLMKRIMPDIPYAQFKGWYKKGLIDYNFYELNAWGRVFAKKEFYDLKDIEVIIPKPIMEKFKKLDVNNIDSNILESILLDLTKETWAIKEQALSKLAYITGISKIILIKKLDELVQSTKILESVNGFDLFNQELKEPEYWLYPIIPKNATIIFGGKPGSFKSFTVFSIIYSLVSNTKFANNFENKETIIPKVLYYDLENGLPLQHWRMKYLKNGHNHNDVECLKNITFSTTFDKLHLDKELQRAMQNDIIVLDSYRRFLTGSENDSEITDEFFSLFIKKLKEAGKTIIIIHHFRKVKLEEFNDGDLTDAFRGSGDITAQLDVVYCVIKGNDMVDLEENTMFDVSILKAKIRNIYPIQPFIFTVTKNDKEKKTTMKFLGYKKHQSPKEKRELKIIDFIKNQNKEVTRKEILDYILPLTNEKEITIDTTLREMIKNGMLQQNTYGKYSLT